MKSDRVKYFADLEAKEVIELKSMHGKKSYRRKEKRKLPKKSFGRGQFQNKANKLLKILKKTY